MWREVIMGAAAGNLQKEQIERRVHAPHLRRLLTENPYGGTFGGTQVIAYS